MAYWGMDVTTYPGDSAMKTIKQNSPLSFTGFYLAPQNSGNHNDTGWMSTYSTLKSYGWGVLPIYVGY